MWRNFRSACAQTARPAEGVLRRGMVHLSCRSTVVLSRGEEPGHDVWTHVPEEGDAQLRGYYALESNWGALEAQVLRGTDAQIVIVDPELNEREESRTPGPGAVATLGEGYGTHDEPGEELEGLTLYTYQDDDPAGTWRGIFMANDNGGVHSPNWRTHTPVRMITANKAKLPICAIVSEEVDDFGIMADIAEQAVRDTRAFSVYVYDPPSEAHIMRELMRRCDLVFFVGHGLAYAPEKREDVGDPYNWNDVLVTDDAVEEAPAKYHGNAVETRHRLVYDNDYLTTTTAVAQRLSDLGDKHPFALFSDGTTFTGDEDNCDEQREGYAPTHYGRLRFAVFMSCNTAHSARSISPMIGRYVPGATSVGLSRKTNVQLAKRFNELFWKAFSERKPGGRLKYDWSRGNWESLSRYCTIQAIQDLHSYYENKHRAAIDYIFKGSDAMRFRCVEGVGEEWEWDPLCYITQNQ